MMPPLGKKPFRPPDNPSRSGPDQACGVTPPAGAQPRSGISPRQTCACRISLSKTRARDNATCSTAWFVTRFRKSLSLGATLGCSLNQSFSSPFECILLYSEVELHSVQNEIAQDGQRFFGLIGNHAVATSSEALKPDQTPWQ